MNLKILLIKYRYLLLGAVSFLGLEYWTLDYFKALSSTDSSLEDQSLPSESMQALETVDTKNSLYTQELNLKLDELLKFDIATKEVSNSKAIPPIALKEFMAGKNLAQSAADSPESKNSNGLTTASESSPQNDSGVVVFNNYRPNLARAFPKIIKQRQTSMSALAKRLMGVGNSQTMRLGANGKMMPTADSASTKKALLEQKLARLAPSSRLALTEVTPIKNSLAVVAETGAMAQNPAMEIGLAARQQLDNSLKQNAQYLNTNISIQPQTVLPLSSNVGLAPALNYPRPSLDLNRLNSSTNGDQGKTNPVFSQTSQGALTKQVKQTNLAQLQKNATANVLSKYQGGGQAKTITYNTPKPNSASGKNLAGTIGGAGTASRAPASSSNTNDNSATNGSTNQGPSYKNNPPIYLKSQNFEFASSQESEKWNLPNGLRLAVINGNYYFYDPNTGMAYLVLFRDFGKGADEKKYAENDDKGPKPENDDKDNQDPTPAPPQEKCVAVSVGWGVVAIAPKAEIATALENPGRWKCVTAKVENVISKDQFNCADVGNEDEIQAGYKWYSPRTCLPKNSIPPQIGNSSVSDAMSANIADSDLHNAEVSIPLIANKMGAQDDFFAEPNSKSAGNRK